MHASVCPLIINVSQIIFLVQIAPTFISLILLPKLWGETSTGKKKNSPFVNCDVSDILLSIVRNVKQNLGSLLEKGDLNKIAQNKINFLEFFFEKTTKKSFSEKSEN